MLKFSNLEKAGLPPQNARKKSGGKAKAASDLSFRDLEKESQRMTSQDAFAPVEASEEERKALYDAATEYLTAVLAAVRKRRRFELEPGQEIVRRMLESRSPVDPLLIRAIYEENPFEYLVNHCVNVAIFAVKMAAVLDLSRHEQERIGLAALLHEVGMGVIPEKLIYKEQKLDEQEYAIFRKRPEFAFKILQGFDKKYSFLADTALQVHECMDGSGYPLGLSGDQIHLYAQIIGLVDMYEALIHSRPQRDKFLHFSAVKQVIRLGKRRYPKKHLKALLNLFSIFPLHSFVKLNSNAVGRVVQTYPEQPMRPKLEIVLDSQGRRVLARHVVDLAENAILHIVDSVSEKDIAGLSEGPGLKASLQTSALIQSDLEAAGVPHRRNGRRDLQPDTEIEEITEADFELPLSPAGKEDVAPFRIALSQPGEKESVDGAPVGLPAAQRALRVRRYKWVLTAFAAAILAGVLLWFLS